MKSLLLLALSHYVVDPTSTIQRLPDAEPTDGEKNGVVKIVAAKDEYEPASFVLKGDADETVRLEIGEVKNEKGEVFPAANLDLRVVKVWYQNRNAWFSYFGDCGWKLVPELLLHDENLVRVDEKTQSNYARLTEADGRVHERWINPPRQFDKRTGRYSWRTAETFQCMKPNFCDAETLQPVKLEKGRYKQFVLTAHVTKDTPAGLYRGEVKVEGEQWKIPLSIKVLDYVLPKPRTYVDPSKDLLVSFYNYMSDNNIMMRNGYDFKRCRALYAPIYRNFAAHGVDNYGIGDSQFIEFSDGALFALREMKKAGLRTDVINGIVHGYGVRSPKYAEVCKTGVKTGSVDVARVKRDAAAATRFFGHRNVHFHYGDEPPANYVMCWRKGLVEYQKWGFRTFMAGNLGVFSKAGHIYDWFNMSSDPTSGENPGLWNGAGAGRISWYANQHVGAEDPEISRRQNGLAGWLSGYTVLCNYALHFGNWNDDSQTYRPMVYAYGSGSGLIDTLAWEGFREGLDDVRYATVLHALALEAVASPDPSHIGLGRRALKWFVSFDRSRDGLAWARAEMIAQIDGLRAALGHDAVLAPLKKDVRNEPEADISQELAADLAACKTTKEVVKTYEKYYFFDKAYEALVASNELVWAANYAANENIRRFDLAEKHLKAVLTDESAKPAERLSACIGLIAYDLPTALKYEDVVFGVSNRLARTAFRELSGVIGNRTYLCDDRPAEAKEVFRMLRRAADAIKGPLGFKNWSYGIHTRFMCDDRTGAAEVAEAALASAEAAKFKPEETYRLQLAAAIGRGKAISVDLGAELDAKKRLNVFCDLAQYVTQGGDEAAVRKLAKAREAMLKHNGKRRYVVKYSEKPIVSPADWDGLGAEKQLLDRRYGGSTEVLYTDVASGRSAVAADKDAKKSVPTMEIVADRFGLHFRFDVEDEKASEIAAGLLAGDGWEGYIAPGKDLAYSAIFMNTGRNGTSRLYGSSYDNATYSRPTLKSRADWQRLMTVYGKDRVTAYLTLKWEMFAKTLPQDGDVWDYENMRWSRSGDNAWNGTDSIHGRSTWGELVFELSPSARAAIVREQLFAARKVYLDEKSDHEDGVLSHWSDPDLGDLAFYAEKVEPVVKSLDAYLPRVTAGMSDDEAETLAREAMPGWLNIRADVQNLRADWLRK